MKPARNIATLARTIYLGSAFALLFFLAASAPHRVHHTFEALFAAPQSAVAHSHDHNAAHHHEHDQGREPNPASSAQPDCAVLAAAQQSHVAAVQHFGVTLVRTVAAQETVPRAFSVSLYNLSPFSQRAPPLA